MLKRIGNSWIVIGSFIGALLLSFAAGPSKRVLGLRAPAECTAPGECSINPPDGYTHTAATGNPRPRVAKVDFVEGRGINGTSGNTGNVTVTADTMFVTLSNNDVIAVSGDSSHRIKMVIEVNGSRVTVPARRDVRVRKLPPGMTVFSPPLNPSGTVATTPCTDLGESFVTINGTVMVAPFAIAAALLEGSGVVSGFSCAAP